MTLTVKQVQDGLSGLGIDKVRAEEDGRITARCPVCSIDWALAYADTPFGHATLTCETDSPDQIEGALRVGLTRLRKLTDDPLAYVRDALDEPDLERIVKHGKGGASYILHYTDNTQVELGGVAILLSQPKFRAAYLPQRRRLPTKHTLKEAQWTRLVESIERAAEERDSVTTDTEEARAWLDAYTRQNRAITLDTADTEALYEHLTPDAGPFTDQHGRLHVRLGDLTAWVNHVGGGRITSRDLSTRLSELGFEKVQPAARRPPHIAGDARHLATRKHRYHASPRDFDLHE